MPQDSFIDWRSIEYFSKSEILKRPDNFFREGIVFFHVMDHVQAESGIVFYCPMPADRVLEKDIPESLF
jgi:hypothetical protein